MLPFSFVGASNKNVFLSQNVFTLDKEEKCGALLIDLSKAFDSLSLDLLLAKPEAHGFSCSFLKLISTFLSNRKHRTKISSAYSNWEDLLLVAPQGTVLGSLLLIYRCAIFPCLSLILTLQIMQMIQFYIYVI